MVLFSGNRVEEFCIFFVVLCGAYGGLISRGLLNDCRARLDMMETRKARSESKARKAHSERKGGSVAVGIENYGNVLAKLR